MTRRGIDWNFEGYKKEAHFFRCGAFEPLEFIRAFLITAKDCPWKYLLLEKERVNNTFKIC